MLHGVIPDTVVPNLPGGFLVPAWSISLEWQFYLIAPLMFALLYRGRSGPWIVMGIVAVLFALSRSTLPKVEYGAFLPFHIEYFFLGAASYLVFKHLEPYLSSTERRGDILFPPVLIMTLMIYPTVGYRTELVPFLIWTAFFALILETEGSWSRRIVGWLFTNKVTNWMGNISYSIYLSHALCITVIAALLLEHTQLSQMPFFATLLVLTLTSTLVVSAALFYAVERPGVRLGRRLAGRLEGKSAPVAPSGSSP